MGIHLEAGAVRLLLVVLLLVAAVAAVAAARSLGGRAPRGQRGGRAGSIIAGCVRPVAAVLAMALLTVPIAGGGPDIRPVALSGPTSDALQRSVLRITDIAPGCGVVQSGTGFVIAPERVLTAAHVVAGASTISVDTPNGPRDAAVVVFDPDTDLAVLAVPGLTVPAVATAGQPADFGTAAVVLGYPEGGSYTVTAALVRGRKTAEFPDIYGTAPSTRQTYRVSGDIREGDSGGPLVDRQGQVLGLVVGIDTAAPGAGYATTIQQALARLGDAWNSHAAVSTGPCIQR